jgi:hypothetical protein
VQTSGNIFTINNAGGLDLNGQTLTLGCAGCMGGSILIDATGGATKSIISTIAGGVFRIQGNVTNAVGKTVTNVGTVTLTFSTNAILAINTCQLNPGANLTTVNSELDIESGGDNITNACTYGPSSTLKFKNASVFVLTATQKTWVSGASGVGVPYNVIIDGASVPGSGIRSNISASYYARKDFTITGNGAVDLSATGAPANNLYVAGNWTGSLTELFTPNTNTVIFNGSSAQTLTLTGGSETFYDLEIANTSGDLTLATSSAITLTHRLRFTSGNIIIGNNNFTYNLLSVADAPNATLGTPSNTCKIVTNGTGVVTIKNLPISNTFFFEIGPTTTSYNKVNWETAGAGHTTDDFSARVVVGLPTDILSTAYVNRTWFVSEGVVGGSNGDINFYWQTAHENPSFTSNRASGTTYHKPAATWNTEPNTNLVPLDNNSANMPAAGWRARAGKITSFSPFIEGTSTALPIELISFTGKAIKDGNLLEWQTGSETNNDYFTLEHAVKSLDFKNIGRIKGAGNSVRILNYSFFDNSSEALQSEVSYYKLKQTDFDGKTTYSKEVAINRANKNCFNLTNYFVDENRNMHLTFNAPDSKIITIEVNDALGQVIYTHSFKEAESTIHFDLPEKYAHQLLFLKVSCGQQIAIKKFYY